MQTSPRWIFWCLLFGQQKWRKIVQSNSFFFRLNLTSKFTESMLHWLYGGSEQTNSAAQCWPRPWRCPKNGQSWSMVFLRTFLNYNKINFTLGTWFASFTVSQIQLRLCNLNGPGKIRTNPRGFDVKIWRRIAKKVHLLSVFGSPPKCSTQDLGGKWHWHLDGWFRYVSLIYISINYGNFGF